MTAASGGFHFPARAVGELLTRRKMKHALVVAALLSASPALAQSDPARPPLPRSDTFPEGVVQLSPVVPRMGEHWANVADMPLGPLYCVYNGGIVCEEFMITQADFAAGKTWTDLTPMPGLPAVDHMNIDFEPNGHEGFEVPHYDIHLYFVTPEEVAAIQ